MKHPEILSKMTLEEKASLCSGFDYWHTAAVNHVGVPSIMLTDGPHGIRKRVDFHHFLTYHPGHFFDGGSDLAG